MYYEYDCLYNVQCTHIELCWCCSLLNAQVDVFLIIIIIIIITPLTFKSFSLYTYIIFTCFYLLSHMYYVLCLHLFTHVCMHNNFLSLSLSLSHTHTHTRFIVSLMPLIPSSQSPIQIPNPVQFQFHEFSILHSSFPAFCYKVCNM